MASADEIHEMDSRFPSGEWTGFYVQPNTRQRFTMDFYLAFQEGRMSGQGVDTVGDFTISGLYDTTNAECRWTKQYVGQHAVEYAGQARQRGIIGGWTIPDQPDFWSGPFFIWPRSLGNLEAMFERAFLEYELLEPTESPTFESL